MKLLEGIEKREWWIFETNFLYRMFDTKGEVEECIQTWKKTWPANVPDQEFRNLHVIDSAYVERLERMLAKAVEHCEELLFLHDAEMKKVLNVNREKLAQIYNAELRAIAEGE